MITPRLLLFYNFGIALLFVVVGILSMVALEPLINRPVVVPPFDIASQQAIHAEQDLEKLRARAAFYFELGRDLKRARYADTDTLFADLRRLCFLVALAFAIGGVLSVLVLRRRSALGAGLPG
jgi:hypothetical protein